MSITENYDNVHPVNKFFKSMLKELDFAGFRENPDPKVGQREGEADC
jgi:hypothetical protein